MLTTNPFAILAETIPMIAIQSFVIIMVGLVILGTVLDMIHKKNVKYFFNNAKKQKNQPKKSWEQVKGWQLLAEQLFMISELQLNSAGAKEELLMS